MSYSKLRAIAAAAVLLSCGCGEDELGREGDGGRERASSEPALKIATWNMEWLHRNNGSGEVPRSNADYQRLADYAELLDADIIALQEVDGVQAASRVFDSSVYDFHMSSRNSVQRTGFVYRKGLNVIENPDYTALNVGGLRYGTDIEVTVDGEVLRLLDIHLKSGCLTQSLGSSSNSCNKLEQQVGILESWIDARAAEGTAFMVLGDFNRRMFANGNDDVWAALDDGSPAGADLSSPTETGTAQCNGGQFPQFIDHLVTGSLATQMLVPGSFSELVFDSADAGLELSDHCPLSVELALGEGSEPPSGPTCAGSCGGQSPSGCWCDDLCEDFGNCCADKVQQCDAPPEPEPEPEPDSCEGSCGGQAPGGCWCDDLCEGFNNCCADKVQQCDAPSEPEPEPDPNSCAESCGQQAPGGCWCDNQCEGFGDCCTDKQAQCG
ncbi:MAG: endonuclease/exonuclease/phosphatase family protein [Deltaproteobacteria bacterium]|nr:endonuclease/exonuclease/phosphatase family protein [Deltaproteobacteria bacterium]